MYFSMTEIYSFRYTWALWSCGVMRSNVYNHKFNFLPKILAVKIFLQLWLKFFNGQHVALWIRERRYLNVKSQLHYKNTYKTMKYVENQREWAFFPTSVPRGHFYKKQVFREWCTKFLVCIVILLTRRRDTHTPARGV